VVGGGGYVGGYLVDLLAKQGHEVGVFDILLYEDRYLKPIRFFFGDIRETSRLLEIAKDFDSVIWLAALVGDPLSALDETLTREINTNSPVRFRKKYNGQFYFMSTCSVYGAQDGVLTEESETNPLSTYATTKLEAEEALQRIGKKDVILRLGTLFGLSDSFSRLRADLVLNVMVIRAVYSGKLTVYGGEQFRPLLHVKDVGNAIAESIYLDLEGIFNVHCTNITIVELANKIKSTILNVDIVTTSSTFQDSRNYSVSSKKIFDATKFKPLYTIESGIEELASALRDGRFPNILNSNYINVDKMRGKYGQRKNPIVTEYFKGMR